MKKYCLILAYDGSAYHGWQTQRKGIATVQHTIEGACTKLLNQKINLIGCGRTDAGVHAKKYYAHFKTTAQIDELNLFVFKLNHCLPTDIAIYKCVAVHDSFHAQHDALWRQYEYHIDLVKNPFRANRSGTYDVHPLDFELMRMTAIRYQTVKDFKGFCRSPNQYKTTECRIDFCKLIRTAENSLVFSIQANRFLHNMVRILVARMIDIGRKRLSLQELEHSILNHEAPKYLNPAYPEGLYLTDIAYPKLELEE